MHSTAFTKPCTELEVTEDDLFPELTSKGVYEIEDVLAYCARMTEQLGLEELNLNQVVLETSHGNTTDLFLINVCLQQQQQLNEAHELIAQINNQLDSFNLI